MLINPSLIEEEVEQEEEDLYEPSDEEISQEVIGELLYDLSTGISAWKDEAACWGKERGYMYPPRADIQKARADQICSSCPKQVDCLFYSLVSKEEFGIWGGVTESERRSILRSFQKVIPNFQNNWSEETKDFLYNYSEQLVSIHKGLHGKNILQA